MTGRDNGSESTYQVAMEGSHESIMAYVSVKRKGRRQV